MDGTTRMRLISRLFKILQRFRPIPTGPGNDLYIGPPCNWYSESPDHPRTTLVLTRTPLMYTGAPLMHPASFVRRPMGLGKLIGSMPMPNEALARTTIDLITCIGSIAEEKWMLYISVNQRSPLLPHELSFANKSKTPLGFGNEDGEDSRKSRILTSSIPKYRGAENSWAKPYHGTHHRHDVERLEIQRNWSI